MASNFIVQAPSNHPITIYGEGTQTRSFCYCDDLIEGCLCMMGTPAERTGPINLGNPDDFTICELAEKVLKLTGSEPELRFQPLRSEDPTQLCPDIRLGREHLDCEPRVQLTEGLEKTIAYFDRLLREV
jgi:UDP-glucuronate decarboxylase